jgi:hypothetical protein
MLRRLVVGLVIGIVLGGIAAGALIKGLGVLAFAETGSGVFLAYAAALATGAFVALVAGKPVWAKGAWIEVGLKAFFGSLLAAAGMFALRRWGGMPIDLSRFGAGTGSLGALPATSLPIIATVLSVLFELDNTDPPTGKTATKPVGAAKRIASGGEAKAARISTHEADGEGEEEAAQPKKKLRN